METIYSYSIAACLGAIFLLAGYCVDCKRRIFTLEKIDANNKKIISIHESSASDSKRMIDKQQAFIETYCKEN